MTSREVMKAILFVDDEPNVLQALQRSLRGMRAEWDMSFASSGAQALEAMAQKHFDIIISDMIMPGMDGATLLKAVMDRHPDTVRFVLSGETGADKLYHSMGLVHQFLSKPCPVETLQASVNRTFALRALLGNEKLLDLVSNMLMLPSFPNTCAGLLDEIASPDASVARVGRLIEADIGMTARVLHCANSVYFGVREHVANPTLATSLLGLNTVKSLVLLAGVFSEDLRKKMPPAFSLEQLERHSMAVGAFSQAIAKQQGCSKKARDEAFTAGILHDAGKLVMATSRPADYGKVIQCHLKDNVPVHVAEAQTFSITHAVAGAYLLGLWGLPDGIIEAVAFHHAPSRSAMQMFGPLVAVHAANAIEHALSSETDLDASQLDWIYLDKLGLRDHIDDWHNMCGELAKNQ